MPLFLMSFEPIVPFLLSTPKVKLFYCVAFEKYFYIKK